MIALAAACDRLLLRSFSRISPCVRAPVQRAWPLICRVVEAPGGGLQNVTAASLPVHLQVPLPTGLALGDPLARTPAFVCSVSGSQPQGQWLVCSRAAGLVAGAVGSIAFEAQVGAGLVSRELDPVVAALDASAQASASVLLDCASNPRQSHCAWHEIPLQGECRDFVEGLYCDGFEAGATP